MATFDLSNSAGRGFDMSETNEFGWAFVYAQPLTTVFLSDTGTFAQFGVLGNSVIDHIAISHIPNDGFSNDHFNIFVEDIYFGRNQQPVLEITDLNLLNLWTTVPDIQSGAVFVNVNRESDRFFGNDFPDFIRAGNGNDSVQAYAGNDVAFGDAGNDSVDGGEGNDVVSGDAGNDGVGGGEGNDVVFGGLGNDMLTGGFGNDTLDGGAGFDILFGGAGNDTYVLGAEKDAIDSESSGTDTITSTITRSLAPFSTIEKLTLVGTAAINGTGNTLNNVITGNAGANILGGGTGVDRLEGGAGNDTYLIDSISDVLVDTAGIDTVRSTASKTLAAGFENLVLLGAAPLAGTGNSAANVLTGHSLANILTGLAGNDTLTGLGGNDLLVGGLGKDILRGGFGRDKFDFNAATESARGVARDVVADFNRAQADKIDLSSIDADIDGTLGNQAFSFIGAVAFSGRDGQLRFAGGILAGDTNGDKIAEFEIQVVGALAKVDLIL